MNIGIIEPIAREEKASLLVIEPIRLTYKWAVHTIDLCRRLA